MAKMILLVNNGVYVNSDGKNVFANEEALWSELLKWSGKNEFAVEDEDDEDARVSVDIGELVEMLIEAGSRGDNVSVYEKSMCEMGDDCVDLGVVELME